MTSTAAATRRSRVNCFCCARSGRPAGSAGGPAFEEPLGREAAIDPDASRGACDAGAAAGVAAAIARVVRLLLAGDLALGDLLLQLLHDRRVAQRGDVAELAALGDVAEQAAHDLARARLGQVGG